MSLIFFIFFCICTISFFIGFVLLEMLHPKWQKTLKNLFVFQLGAVIGAALFWFLLYKLSHNGNMGFENILDILLLFSGSLAGIIGGGLLFVFVKRKIYGS